MMVCKQNENVPQSFLCAQTFARLMCRETKAEVRSVCVDERVHSDMSIDVTFVNVFGNEFRARVV